jgi:O-antigen ligase
MSLFAPLKFTGLGIIVLAIAWFFSSSFTTKIVHFKTNYFQYLFFALYAWYILGLLYTQNLSYGGSLIETMLSIFAFPLIFSSLATFRINVVTFILNFFVYCACLISIFCVGKACFNYASCADIDLLYYHKLAKNVDFSAIYLSLYIAMAYLIVLLQWLPAAIVGSLKSKIVSFALLGFFFLFLILLSSKMIIACITALTMILVFIRILPHKASLTSILIAIAILMGVMLMVANLKVTRQRFQNVELKAFKYTDVDVNGLTGRIAMWTCAKDVIKNNFWLGVGTGDIDDELIAEYHKKDFRVGYFWKYNAHNQYIQTFLGQGFVGFCLLMALFIIPFIYGCRKRDYLYLSFCVLFFSLCITETTFTNVKGVCFFAFFNSFFIFQGFLKNRPLN